MTKTGAEKARDPKAGILERIQENHQSKTSFVFVTLPCERRRWYIHFLCVSASPKSEERRERERGRENKTLINKTLIGTNYEKQVQILQVTDENGDRETERERVHGLEDKRRSLALNTLLCLVEQDVAYV